MARWSGNEQCFCRSKQQISIFIIFSLSWSALQSFKDVYIWSCSFVRCLSAPIRYIWFCKCNYFLSRFAVVVFSSLRNPVDGVLDLHYLLVFPTYCVVQVVSHTMSLCCFDMHYNPHLFSLQCPQDIICQSALHHGVLKQVSDQFHVTVLNIDIYKTYELDGHHMMILSHKWKLVIKQMGHRCHAGQVLVSNPLGNFFVNFSFWGSSEL